MSRRVKMKRSIIIQILIAFAVFFIFSCTAQIEKDDAAASYIDITAGELKNMLENKDFFLVDVHIPEQEHIPGTDALIPFNDISNNLNKLPEDKNAKIVVYCRSGHMSVEASQKLAEFGYTNVYNVLGGKKAFDALEGE